jgi:hypothetical protein
MQKRAAKFIVLISISFFTVLTYPIQAAPVTLTTADSLFEAKRYTQALNQFQQIFENDRYTPAMLLKMAYIHEGLGNIAKTQYFLNLYFLATNDDSVLTKMEELATSHQLEGYTISDQQRVLLLVKEHASALSLILVGFMVLSMALAMYGKRQQQRGYLGYGLFMLMVVAFVALKQQTKEEEAAIVLNENTYVMNGASAGADVLEIVEAGHRVQVLGKKDVWFKIRWRDQDAYLKEGSLQPVVL